MPSALTGAPLQLTPATARRGPCPLPTGPGTHAYPPFAQLAASDESHRAGRLREPLHLHSTIPPRSVDPVVATDGQPLSRRLSSAQAIIPIGQLLSDANPDTGP